MQAHHGVQKVSVLHLRVQDKRTEDNKNEKSRQRGPSGRLAILSCARGGCDCVAEVKGAMTEVGWAGGGGNGLARG